MPGLTSNEMATGYHKINGSNTLQDKITHSHKCLSSGSLSNLIDSTDQVIFTMPAKAGGTSMKRFAKACNDDSYKKLGDNFLNSQNQTEQLLTISYEMPGVIASHMYQGQYEYDLSKLPMILGRQSLSISAMNRAMARAIRWLVAFLPELEN